MTVRRRLTAAVLLPALLLTAGCAQSVDPIERLGKKAAQRVDRPAARPAADEALPPYRRWGLPAPLARPPKPPLTRRTHPANPGLPVVVDHIRTRDRVVFLTYDTGAGTRRDPRFAGMVRDLRLPVTAFDTGGNRPLKGLPYAAQHTRICTRLDRLRLLRPPRGAYDTTTLRAAADCKVSALILWRASMATGTLTYRHGDHHLHPGDIVRLGRPTRSLRTRTTRLLKTLQHENLTPAHLEDYL